MANEFVRKQYVGGAIQTTISAGISDVDASVSIASTAGWPLETATPFCVTIDPNNAAEETLLVTRSGSTLTVVERGYDGTTAVAHTVGANIIHSHDAHTDDQNNRMANLMDAKGELLGHDGTNSVAIDGPIGAGDDGKLMTADNAAASGWSLQTPANITVDPNAPNAATAVYRVWYDETLDLLRASDGASWQQQRTAYYFADIAARKAELVTPKAGQIAQLGTGITEFFDGSTWKVLGVAQFANATARDAYFADATVTVYDGAMAKTLDDYVLWEYRQDEWIRLNFKVTVSATQPSAPHEGDIWLQPV